VRFCNSFTLSSRDFTSLIANWLNHLLSNFNLTCEPARISILSLFDSRSFFFAVPLHGALSNGQRYRINFVDVDGNPLSTADGHVTVLVLTTPEDRDKARTVGDRVPNYCLGNPNYRMITILDFTKRRTQIGREIATTLVRHHLDEEAKRLQVRYDEKKIARDARGDIFTVTDFDGTVSSQLSLQATAESFGVFVFARNGELLQHWDDVPSAEALAAVVK
jgi:hypothetical protein